MVRTLAACEPRTRSIQATRSTACPQGGGRNPLPPGHLIPAPIWIFVRAWSPRKAPKEVNLMVITIKKVEKIEATRIHTDPSQAA
jgi:hypothetical protein